MPLYAASLCCLSLQGVSSDAPKDCQSKLLPITSFILIIFNDQSDIVFDNYEEGLL
jgi:hypothetical protein